MENPFKLRNDQRDALNRMHNGCILCGGVGSGKSRTALAYYYKINNGYFDSEKFIPMNDPPLKLYIITTAKKRDSKEWEEEMIPFLMSENGNLYSENVVVDSWNNIKKYTEVENSFFIFDEQRVIGYGAWTQSFLKITKANQWILLSATPGDTWSDYAPVFIANGYFKNITQFRREHIVYKYAPNLHYPQIDRYVSETKLLRLRNSILVTMDYTRPALLHENDIVVDYDMNLYRSIMRDRWDPWENEPIQNISSLCFCLRKAINTSDSRKLAVLEITDKNPKVIIFYNYNFELEILRNLPYVNGTVVAELNGQNHNDIPKSDRWVYLVNYNAGAEAWNCIETDTMIFYSMNYSYRIMTQAKGRIDRANTPFKDLYYYNIKSKASIDLAIARALKRKRNFNERGFTSHL